MTRRAMTVGGAILVTALGGALAVQAFASTSPPDDAGATDAPADVVDEPGVGTDPEVDWDTGPLPSDEPTESVVSEESVAPGDLPTGTAPPSSDQSLAGADDPEVSPETDAPAVATPSQAGGTPVHLVFAERRGTTVAASGYADVIELGGTCELVVVGPGGAFSVSGDAVADASTTSCGELTVTDPSLGEGEWTATLTYASPVSAGVSPTSTVVNR